LSAESSGLRGPLVHFLGVYPIPQGEDFLLSHLGSGPQSQRTRLKAVRALASYKSPEVIQGLVKNLEEDSPLQGEVVRSLRKITGKNFGYEFGKSGQENTEALKKWQSLQ